MYSFTFLALEWDVRPHVLNSQSFSCCTHLIVWCMRYSNDSVYQVSLCLLCCVHLYLDYYSAYVWHDGCTLMTMTRILDFLPLVYSCIGITAKRHSRLRTCSAVLGNGPSPSDLFDAPSHVPFDALYRASQYFVVIIDQPFAIVQ